MPYQPKYIPPMGKGLRYIRVERLQQCQGDRCSRDARFDAKTARGPWAYLCEQCAREEGVSIGLGRGQLLLVIGEALPDYLLAG